MSDRIEIELNGRILTHVDELAKYYGVPDNPGDVIEMLVLREYGAVIGSKKYFGKEVANAAGS